MRRQPLGFTSSETQFAFLLRLTSTDALEVLEGAGHLPDLHLALNLDPRHVPLAAKLFWQPPGPACLSKWPSRGHCYWASRARTQHPTCLSVAVPVCADSVPPPPILLDPQQQETRPQQPRRWPSRSRPLGLPGPGSSALSTLPPCSACHLRTRCPCWGGVNLCGLTQGSFFECAGSCPAEGPTHPAGSASSPKSRLGQRMGSVWLLSTCPNRFTCRPPFSLALLASLRMLPARVTPAGPRLRVQAHPTRGA